MSIKIGTNHTVTYEPDQGYKLASIEVDDEYIDITGNESQYTFENITDHHKIRVVYAKVTYKVTTEIENGTIMEGATVAEGEDMTITFHANEGYRIVSVYVNNKEVDALHAVDLKGIKEDIHIKVLCEPIPVLAYEIKTVVENGDITDGTQVNPGDSFTVQYKPNDGYKLASVTVNGEEVDAPNEYTFDDIQKDHEIKVVYEPVTYTIKTSVEGGTITKTQSVKHGEDLKIEYKPNDGYKLAKILVDSKEVDAETFKQAYIFTKIDADHEISVIFEKQAVPAKTYKIETTASGGTITKTSEVKEGEDITISYKPNDGYKLAKVLVDGKEIDIKKYPEQYTFTKVNASHKISAIFEKEEQKPKTETKTVTKEIVTNKEVVTYKTVETPVVKQIDAPVQKTVVTETVSAPEQTQTIYSRGTGDASNIMLYLGIFAFALSTSVSIIHNKRKKAVETQKIR